MQSIEKCLLTGRNAMAIFLVLFLTVLAVPALAAAENDGWHFSDPRNHINPFFWDFKYFNFHSKEFDGSITYFTVAPKLIGKSFITATMTKGDKTYILQKSFPLKCVQASQDSASINICGKASVSQPSALSYNVTLTEGPLQWNLTVSGEDGIEEPVHINLDSILPFSLDSYFINWEILWRPVLLEGMINGIITIDGVQVSLNNEPSYHDENWGTWLPSAQPFRWLHFSGTDQFKQRIDLILGEFPKNKTGEKGALVLNFPSSDRHIRYENYELRASQEKPAQVVYSDPKLSEKLDILNNQLPKKNQTHRVPEELEISTPDGHLHLRANTISYSAISTKSSWWIQKFTPDFVINELVLDAELSFTEDHSGEPLVMKGKAEYMSAERP